LRKSGKTNVNVDDEQKKKEQNRRGGKKKKNTLDLLMDNTIKLE